MKIDAGKLRQHKITLAGRHTVGSTHLRAHPDGWRLGASAIGEDHTSRRRPNLLANPNRSSAWLSTIVRNTTMDHIRSRFRLREHPTDTHELSAQLELAAIVRWNPGDRHDRTDSCNNIVPNFPKRKDFGSDAYIRSVSARYPVDRKEYSGSYSASCHEFIHQGCKLLLAGR